MGVKKLILNKLKSKKASALLLAMLFSLMCIILGMVVLSAGEVSNGRIINAAKAEQSYYIASSLFREFQQEARYTYTNSYGLPVTKGMLLRANTFTAWKGSDFGHSEFDYNNAFSSTLQNEHQLTTLRPFIARGLYEAMAHGSYSNELSYTLGGAGDLEETKYTAKVKITITDADYSIYIDVIDVIKGGEDGESLGAPHLDTIVIPCRRITPKAAQELESGASKLTDAVFEYDQARLLH